MKKFSGYVTVINKQPVSENVFTLEISCPEIAQSAKPGQFIQVKIDNSNSTLWPRPFSIHKVSSDTVAITIKICGKVTNKLAMLSSEDKIFVTGPLGNGFKMPARDTTIIMVAGGVGLPPLQILCDFMLKSGHSAETIYFYSGAKNAKDLFADQEISALGINYRVSTEDGSSGYKGLVTDLLAEKLTDIGTTEKANNIEVYSCGPILMLKKVAEICSGYECYVSLEQLMPCGWGVCNGCAVRIKKTDESLSEDEKGFRLARVCKEGPVFNASEILWE